MWVEHLAQPHITIHGGPGLKLLAAVQLLHWCGVGCGCLMRLGESTGEGRFGLLGTLRESVSGLAR